MEMNFKQKALMKKRFYEKFKNECSKNKNNLNYSIQKINSLIEEVKLVKSNTIKKIPRHYWLLDHYNVLMLDGVEHLVTPVTEKNPQVKYYCSNDDVFDILYEAHVSIGHGGRDKMIQQINKRYKNISQKEIRMFLNLCETCQNKRNEMTKESVKPKSHYINSRCQVDLIDLQSQPDENYKFIFIYRDHSTMFTILRSLQTKTAREIAGQLLDIFLLFGAPIILQSSNSREFCNCIIKELKVLWPELTIVIGKPRSSEVQDNIEKSNRDIENMLKTWMAENKTNKWSVGLKYVQFMKNRAIVNSNNKSPYETMFGCVARVGLESRDLPKDVYYDVQYEEQLENIILHANCLSSTKLTANGIETSIQLETIEKKYKDVEIDVDMVNFDNGETILKNIPDSTLSKQADQNISESIKTQKDTKFVKALCVECDVECIENSNC